jgi:hypothetical protein
MLSLTPTALYELAAPHTPPLLPLDAIRDQQPLNSKGRSSNMPDISLDLRYLRYAFVAAQHGSFRRIYFGAISAMAVCNAESRA